LTGLSGVHFGWILYGIGLLKLLFYGIRWVVEETDNEEYFELMKQWVDCNLESGVPTWTVNAVSMGPYLAVAISTDRRREVSEHRVRDGRLPEASRSFNVEHLFWLRQW
jgi:hypothetical protein